MRTRGKRGLTTKKLATLATWCCNLCKTGPPDTLSLDLERINSQFITQKVTTCRLPLWLSFNLCYLKCRNDPERWLVLSSTNCQLTELIRIVKTRKQELLDLTALTVWQRGERKSVDEQLRQHRTAMHSELLYSEILKYDSSLFFLRQQPKHYQQSQKENWMLSVWRSRGWKELWHHVNSKWTCFWNTAVQL